MEISVKQVGKVYGSGPRRYEAIRAVSFDVAAGEFVSLLGPSGCGKSTLLMIIGGINRATSGSVEIAGRPVQGPQRAVGMVFQSPNLLPWRTTTDNVLFPIEMLGLSARDYRDRARELLRLTDLSEFSDRLPRELSGGMQQRVAICRALIHDPPVLLMDEPFGALDAMTRDEMNLELARIWEQHRKTIVFVTHSIREAVFLSNRVFVMGGRPGSIGHCREIRLPHPRGLEIQDSPQFGEDVAELRKVVELSKRGVDAATAEAVGGGGTGGRRHGGLDH